MIRFRFASFLTVLAFAAALMPAAAQTPTASVPSQCMVRPVGVLDVLSMLNDVDEANYLPGIGSISMQDITQGKAISAEDMTGIAFTTDNLVGCANSLEVMSVLALLTREFQTRLVAEAMSSPDMDEIIDQLPILATDTAENEGVQAIPILSAWYADSNERTIRAILQPVVSDPSAQHSYLVTFVFSINQWLVDDIKLIEGSATS